MSSRRISAVMPLRALAARRSSARVRRLLLTVVAATWLGVGGYGFYAYVGGYSTYRGFPPPRDPPGVAEGSVLRQTFYSPALGAWRSYLVYLPPGYRKAVRNRVRFPALYLLHPPPGRPDDYVRGPVRRPCAWTS